MYCELVTCDCCCLWQKIYGSCGYFPLNDLLLTIYIANYGMIFPNINRSQYLIVQLSKSVIFHNLECGMDEQLVSEFLYLESKVFCLLQHSCFQHFFFFFFFNTVLQKFSSVFFQATKNRTQGNGLKRKWSQVALGWFGLGTRKNFFRESVVKRWDGLPREEVEASSLEVLRNHMDVAVRGMV